MFSSLHLPWRRELLVPPFHPWDSLIRLHTAPYEFIGLSPGLQKIIQDYSTWRSEGGHVLCL